MRAIKTPGARQKVIECNKCHCMTSTLFRKAWVKKPLKGFKELQGYYRCTNCGVCCYKIFTTEPI